MKRRHTNAAKYMNTWKPKPELISSVSETVPDQVLSIKELLNRHLQGQQIPELTLIHDPDGNMPDPRSLDLVDIQELKQQNDETIREIKKTVKRTRSAKENKAAREDEPEKEPTDAPTISNSSPHYAEA